MCGWIYFVDLPSKRTNPRLVPGHQSLPPRTVGAGNL